ncbi:deoxyribonuclease-2-alpha-like [Saccostrea echinata]|uniref:deoxyribonuclease-2-alpha-like n=1 Tax=Saccostrea echinata TaxID=191078 RepID=UPI002A83ACB4|nr:deoxyribonuclease-2-alpha-like [Saccostrea echinata]
MVVPLCFCLNCVSPSGKPVDWFIIYKVPVAKGEMPIKTTGEEFYYLDALNPVFSYIRDSIQKKQNNPLFNTLQQIYDGWINETPKTEDSGCDGAYAFDEKDGFWLISSVPRFPAPRTQGYNYGQGQLLYAQSVLCVTLDKKYLTEMGNTHTGTPSHTQKIFNLTKPMIYDNNGPLTENKEIDYSNIPVSETSTVVPFTSKGEQKFLLFAKSVGFRKDLYDSLVAEKLEDNLFVETWRPNLPSNCLTHYKVYNVKRVEFVHDKHVYWFKSTRDHAKWAIAENKPWTCIGDINRNHSQLKRGGGTMCLYHEGVSNQFRKLVKDFDKCKRKGTVLWNS